MYQTTWYDNPEDNTVHGHGCENIKISCAALEIVPRRSEKGLAFVNAVYTIFGENKWLAVEVYEMIKLCIL
jgi:hypothetical protein